MKSMQNKVNIIISRQDTCQSFCLHMRETVTSNIRINSSLFLRIIRIYFTLGTSEVQWNDNLECVPKPWGSYFITTESHFHRLISQVACYHSLNSLSIVFIIVKWMFISFELCGGKPHIKHLMFQESLLHRSIKAFFWLKISTTSVRFNIIIPLREIRA